MSNTNALDVLIQALRRLPGVGVKSASRMAFHLLQHDRPGALALSRALQRGVEKEGEKRDRLGRNAFIWKHVLTEHEPSVICWFGQSVTQRISHSPSKGLGLCSEDSLLYMTQVIRCKSGR